MLLEPNPKACLILCIGTSYRSYDAFAGPLVDGSVFSPMLYYVGSQQFAQLRVLVTVNTRRQDLLDGVIDRSTLKHLVLDNGHESVVFTFVNHAVIPPFFLTWKTFFLDSADIQLWASSPLSRRWGDAFKQKFLLESQVGLMRRLAFELDGNTASTLDLVGVIEMYARYSIDPSAPPPSLVQPLVSFLATLPERWPGISLDLHSLTNSANLVDSASRPQTELCGPPLLLMNTLLECILAARIRPCFGGFVSWSDLIMHPSDLAVLCDSLSILLPKPTNAIMTMLGYAQRQNHAWCSHLSRFS
jgi:hypothetical protein